MVLKHLAIILQLLRKLIGKNYVENCLSGDYEFRLLTDSLNKIMIDFSIDSNEKAICNQIKFDFDWDILLIRLETSL